MPVHRDGYASARSLRTSGSAEDRALTRHVYGDGSDLRKAPRGKPVTAAARNVCESRAGWPNGSKFI
eukprot:4370607-Prymnesium_polylepis.2